LIPRLDETSFISAVLSGVLGSLHPLADSLYKQTLSNMSFGLSALSETSEAARPGLSQNSTCNKLSRNIFVSYLPSHHTFRDAKVDRR
jgi:hypothetical protein